MPALTFCTTLALQPAVWLNCLALPPPRVYPPAVRGNTPPVRFGRRVEAKGVMPRLYSAALVRDTGSCERRGREDCLTDLVMKVR